MTSSHPPGKTYALVSRTEGSNQRTTQNTVSADVHKECNLTLSSNIRQDLQLDISGLLVLQLSNNLPSKTIDCKSIPLLEMRMGDMLYYFHLKMDIQTNYVWDNPELAQ